MNLKERNEQRMKEFGLQHVEAFCLMLYRAKDGQEEWLWNSRDGVTPFCIMSRNGQEMNHVEWYRDQFLPNHKPKIGERIFVDVTPELATPGVQAFIERTWEQERFPMKERWFDKEAAFEALLPSYSEPGQPFVLEITQENIGDFVKPVKTQAEQPLEDETKPSLTFRQLAEINLERCLIWHKDGLEDWSVSDWACAMAGEAGEVCNAVKKLRRIECDANSVNNPESHAAAISAIALEIGDTLLYLNLLALRLGIDLEQAVKDTFNRVSEREGFPQRL